MNLSIKLFWDLMIQSITRPREGARAVLSLPIPPQAWRIGLALVVVLGMLLTQLSDRLLGGGIDPISQLFRASPIMMALIMGGLTFLTAWLMYFIGLKFGGMGDFEGALALVVWLQTILLVLQVIQFIALLFFPPLAVLLGPVSLVLSLWLTTAFAAELHGFKSLLPVFIVMIFTAMALGMVIIVVMSLLGFTSATGGFENV
ncbi:hypothetical protein ATO10_03375 [Actibacterium atlanticum]|uniref:Yip1 domain-containing protein n=1 Tax=Actibacterium atlanticum TaxID=1461693 RepID=A0A058ZQC9_9RHOB|nr:Yip1 family protein [Actibacterium atlanticum]KCV83769.1 hypothetical protein ATO10_03375 [Actibacterium atlanticum]